MVQKPFATHGQRHRSRCGIELFNVLNDISRSPQLFIDNKTRFFLGTHPTASLSRCRKLICQRPRTYIKTFYQAVDSSVYL